MGKKRGRKANYITYAGTELKDTIGGRDIGVSLHTSTKNYYVMLPCSTGTKRKWLGSDLEVAVVKYRAIISGLKGEQEIYIEVKAPEKIRKKGEPLKRTIDGAIDGGDTIDFYPVKYSNATPESEYIEWLKKELQDPKELAKKTGIEALAQLTQIIEEDNHIKLSSLIDNYLSKKKVLCEKEIYNSKLFFKAFLSAIDCKTVEQITLKDIHNYEDFLHSQKLSAKSIKNQLSKITAIFKYNCGRYNSTKLLQIHSWISGIDKPISDKPFNPVVFPVEDFNTIFDNNNIKIQLMLLLSLNCAMYSIDISRLKLSNINLKEGTVAFRRGKTGKVLAVSTLWDRTKTLLEKYLKERKGNSKYVLLSQYGKNYSAVGITNKFKAVREKENVNKEVKFNHLRDTFSTLAQDLGYPIEQINLVLGHQNKGMQDRYAVRNAGKLTKELCEAVEKEFFQIK